MENACIGSESDEMTCLRLRISWLEACVCDLLVKNERLRSALSTESCIWMAQGNGI
jgi:hypothetical protein